MKEGQLPRNRFYDPDKEGHPMKPDPEFFVNYFLDRTDMKRMLYKKWAKERHTERHGEA